ncbi:AAA family ATPase [Aquabacterium sp. OR-4]|uniref:AAA family ATPase n=1 Tax=Aquabacterium sp. OR-4 TaxID=2978127 RepID=UPI0028C78F66|nr:AAA family ATPase [Aquabacterium sp. OR-4]MDT7833655.1 AAA family ATPase [Aquabacterium sp. OR-4]
MAFQITRLQVEQLRRFRQPLLLEGFEPGLNILAGPNEAGKSTLVRAIRAAFFERHRSTAVDDLRPWGEGSSATPTITLDFMLDGQPHHLVKSFLGKKRCTLQIGSQRALDGAEAEDHLAQRFGFGFAAKGASRPEHWGIPGLLWVEQGSGQALDVSHAREHLHDALQGQADAAGGPAALGGLAASGGDELLQWLRGQRDELLTAKGVPRRGGGLPEATELADEQQAQISALDQQIASYRQQVDQLATLRAQHQADETAQPWAALRSTLAEAQARQQALAGQQQQLAADQARAAQLAQTRQLLAGEIDALARQQAQAAQRGQALAQATQQLQAADAAVAVAAAGVQASQARAQAARLAWRTAREAAQRQALAQQLQQAQADAARQADALQRADAAHQHLATLRAQAAAHPAIGEAQLKVLQRLDRGAREAALRRQAVATRLQFDLPAGQALGLARGAAGGADAGAGAGAGTGEVQRTLQGQGELLLDSPATLALPGGGTLRITPGGQDLAALARQHDEALAALQAALQGQGLADLAEAEARLAAHTERQAQIRLAEQALAIVAPQGLAPVQAAAGEAQARIASAQAALDRLPANANASATTTTTTALPLDEAEAAHDAATRSEQAAAEALAGAQRRQAATASALDSAQREHAAAQAALVDPARAARQQQAQQQLLATQAEHEALAARIGQAQAALAAARPDIVAQDIARLARSIEQLLQAHQQRREQLLVLEGTLQQAGAQGLEEQRDSLAGALARTRRRAAELQHRAAALALLCSRIEARRQATLSRLQAPLQQRLQHYLPLLLPGAAVQMDAQLAPESLTRPAPDGGAERAALDELSFGAREQLRLISRFAYADLLQQAGRPTLLILDDALVHSDAERLGAMKRVLFDAAQRHQLLLFTCHPEQWRDMGVALRQL